MKCSFFKGYFCCFFGECGDELYIVLFWGSLLSCRILHSPPPCFFSSLLRLSRTPVLSTESSSFPEAMPFSCHYLKCPRLSPFACRQSCGTQDFPFSIFTLKMEFLLLGVNLAHVQAPHFPLLFSLLFQSPLLSTVTCGRLRDSFAGIWHLFY